MRALLILLLLASLTVAVWAENRTIPVRFSPGSSGATMVEGIARGETATFTLEAAAGQKMRVGMTSVEDNAEFEVIAPGGNSLGSSSDKNGEQVWYGALPGDGNYEIVVGTTRGGAEVTITFVIK
jgi:hypothetical protein